MKNWILGIKTWLTLALLSVAGTARAGFDAQQTAGAIIDGNPEGLSLDLVRQLLGGWVDQVFANGGATGNNPVSGVMYVAGYANALALILGTAIVTYAIISAVMRSANEGVVMGKAYSTMWLPLRTALAFGLVMPVAGMGAGHVSMVQTAVVYMAIMGTNPADTIWEGAVEYLGENPLIYVRPTSGLDTATKVLEGVSCAAAIKYDRETRHGVDGNYPLYRVTTAGTGAVTSVPAYGTINIAQISTLEFGKDGECGRLTVPHPSGATEAEGIIRDAAIRNWHPVMTSLVHGAEQIVRDLILPVGGEVMAEAITEAATGSPEAQNSPAYHNSTQAYQRFSMIANNYGQGLTNAVIQATSSGNAQAQAARQRFTDSLTQQGWVGAGQFYVYMSKYGDAGNAALSSFAEVVSSGAITEVGGNVGSEIMVCSDCNGIKKVVDHITSQTSKVTANSTLALSVGAQSGVTGNQSQGLADIGIRSLVKQHCDVLPPSCDAGAIFDSLSAAFAQDILKIVAASGSTTNATNNSGALPSVADATGSANPMVTMTNIGRGLLNNAVLLTGISIAIKPFTHNQGSKLIGLDGVGNAIGSYILMLVMATFSMGFMLAFILPWMPTFIYLLMVVGWLIMLVEAMVASPLHMIMAAMPEGEGISGSRQERGYAIIAALILRPSLIVIAFIASIGLSYLAFAIFNGVFWTVQNMHTSFGLFEIIAILAIYTGGAFYLAKMVFSVIHTLPNNMLEWLTTAGTRAFGENAATSESSGAASAMGSATGGAAQGALKTVRNRSGANGSGGGAQ